MNVHVNSMTVPLLTVLLIVYIIFNIINSMTVPFILHFYVT